MSTLETVLLSLLVIDALALITLILIQQGKGADVGAAFGSGSSNTVFGSSGGATAMTRLTTWLAIGFFVIAFGLAYTAKERSEQAGNLGIPQVIERSSENALDLPLSDDLAPAAGGQNDEIPEF
ncbi:MAG: preprotein translocase subunit SecG [Proteobacteria bacterium]|jgi:preprotein translocase subunit SecG|nr:preprotein translocase subunit SecG [Pseudomonadota bacterium]